MLPIVQKILRSLKHTEDATAEDVSPHVYILCDMALAVASAIAQNQQPSRAKGKQPSPTAFPGNVPLPASFYRSLDMRISGTVPTVHCLFCRLCQMLSCLCYYSYEQPSIAKGKHLVPVDSLETFLYQLYSPHSWT